MILKNSTICLLLITISIYIIFYNCLQDNTIEGLISSNENSCGKCKGCKGLGKLSNFCINTIPEEQCKKYTTNYIWCGDSSNNITDISSISSIINATLVDISSNKIIAKPNYDTFGCYRGGCVPGFGTMSLDDCMNKKCDSIISNKFIGGWIQGVKGVGKAFLEGNTVLPGIFGTKTLLSKSEINTKTNISHIFYTCGGQGIKLNDEVIKNITYKDKYNIINIIDDNATFSGANGICYNIDGWLNYDNNGITIANNIANKLKHKYKYQILCLPAGLIDLFGFKSYVQSLGGKTGNFTHLAPMFYLKSKDQMTLEWVDDHLNKWQKSGWDKSQIILTYNSQTINTKEGDPILKHLISIMIKDGYAGIIGWPAYINDNIPNSNDIDKKNINYILQNMSIHDKIFKDTYVCKNNYCSKQKGPHGYTTLKDFNDNCNKILNIDYSKIPMIGWWHITDNDINVMNTYPKRGPDVIARFLNMNNTTINTIYNFASGKVPGVNGKFGCSIQIDDDYVLKPIPNEVTPLKYNILNIGGWGDKDNANPTKWSVSAIQQLVNNVQGIILYMRQNKYNIISLDIEGNTIGASYNFGKTIDKLFKIIKDSGFGTMLTLPGFGISDKNGGFNWFRTVNINNVDKLCLKYYNNINDTETAFNGHGGKGYNAALIKSSMPNSIKIFPPYKKILGVSCANPDCKGLLADSWIRDNFKGGVSVWAKGIIKKTSDIINIDCPFTL